MKSYSYTDKHGNSIEAGMKISICGDKPELVYPCYDQLGRDDLGISAISEARLKRFPDTSREYYSLNNFVNTDIEILEGGRKYETND